MSEFSGKTILLTGAAGGLGREIAAIFANKGAKLALADNDENGLKKTVENCRKISSDCEIFSRKTEARDLSDVKELAKATMRKFGAIDVLINNVGVLAKETISEASEEEFAKIMDVNLKSAIFLTKEVLPHLVETKGSVVNISSVVSVACSHMHISYSISKAALATFTKCVAKDYVAHGVKVNSLSPGGLDTKMLTEEMREILEIQQPLGGIIQPEAIAQWAVFLASKESGPITGQNIVVDGGYDVIRGAPPGYELTKSN